MDANKTEDEKMNENKTIGTVVDEKVKEYFKLYDKLVSDDDPEIRRKAVSLARHDLLMDKIVARMALEKLDKKLAEREEIKELDD